MQLVPKAIVCACVICVMELSERLSSKDGAVEIRCRLWLPTMQYRFLVLHLGNISRKGPLSTIRVCVLKNTKLANRNPREVKSGNT